jgi:Zn-dependent peptidase ImmA (M78 family)
MEVNRVLELEGITKQNISEPPVHEFVLNQIKDKLENDLDSFIDWFSAKVIWDENKFPWLNVWENALSQLSDDKILPLKDKLFDKISSSQFPQSEGSLFMLALLFKKYSSYWDIDNLLELTGGIPDESLRLNAYNCILSSFKVDRNKSYKTARIMMGDGYKLAKSVGVEETNLIHNRLDEIIDSIATGNGNNICKIIEFLASNKANDAIIIKLAGMFSQKYVSSNEWQRSNLLNLFIESLSCHNNNSPKVVKFAEFILSYEYLKDNLAEKLNYTLIDRLRPWTTINNGSEKLVKRKKWARKLITELSTLPMSELAIAARNLIEAMPAETSADIFGAIEECKKEATNYEVIHWNPKNETSFSMIREMLGYHRVKSDYIDIIEFASKFGLKCRDVKAPKEFYGILVKSINLPFPLIIFNYNHHNHVQRFTIAHELSHFFLPAHNEKFHECDIDQLIYLNDFSGEMNYEAEANELAAWMLMPDDNVLKYLEQGINGWETIRELQDKFDVSLIAMARKVVDVSSKPIAIIRLIRNGDTAQINFARGSKIDDFPYWALRKNGTVHRNSSVMEIVGGEDSAEKQVPLLLWCELDKLHESFRGYEVKEYAIKYGEDRILVMLQVLNWKKASLEDEIHEEEYDEDWEEHHRHKKGLTIKDFYKLK